MITRDEIIKMAREAGFGPAVAWNEYAPLFERFFHAAYAAGAKAEREACAKVCEAEYPYTVFHTDMGAAINCAAAIRARSEK